MGARSSAISRVGGDGIVLFPHMPQIRCHILLRFQSEFDISYFKNAFVLTSDEKQVLASSEDHPLSHIDPIRHPAQPDALISMLVRIRVEYRKEHLPHWASMRFESRRNPEQIAQPLWSRDMQMFNLLKRQPDIRIMDNDLQKWRQQIVTIAPLTEGLSRKAPLQGGLRTLRLLQECHSFCRLMVTELV